MLISCTLFTQNRRCYQVRLPTCLTIYSNSCNSKEESGTIALKMLMSSWVITQVPNVYHSPASCSKFSCTSSFSSHFCLDCYWAPFLPCPCCVHLISYFYTERCHCYGIILKRGTCKWGVGYNSVFPSEFDRKKMLPFHLFPAISHRFALITVYLFLHSTLVLISTLSHHHIYGLVTLDIVLNAVSLRSVSTMPAVAVFLDYNWLHFSSPEVMC